MRKPICVAFILFVLFSVYVLGAQPNGSIFSALVDPIQMDLPPVNPSVVLRQRLVNVQFHLLADGDETIIHLNPFDDVQLAGVRERTERNAIGGYAWYGRIKQVPPAEVVLVVEGSKLSASITRADRKYTVQHLKGDLHLIREINLAALPASSLTAQTLSLTSQVVPSTFETDILDLVNQERLAQNLRPLNWDDQLYGAARGHSEDMAVNNYFSHTSLDGRTVSARIETAGYQANAAGENIAAGYSTPQATMNGWMNSTGHKENILSSNYCDLGVGYAYAPSSTYGHYWTQDFGRRIGVSSCPSQENQSPIASFTATPISGSLPLTVSFDASASSDPDGRIVSFDWNFGDGQTGTGETPQHIYSAAGTFTVTLAVADSSGASSSVARTNYITVSDPASSTQNNGDDSSTGGGSGGGCFVSTVTYGSRERLTRGRGLLRGQANEESVRKSGQRR